MKKMTFIVILFCTIIKLQAQDVASITTLTNTDEVFMWIERAKALKKKLNQTTAEKEELERLIGKIRLEKKKAELNFSTADLKLQQLASTCNKLQDENIRIRDSLDGLIQIYMQDKAKADMRRRELEAAVEVYKATNENQKYLLDARENEFVEAQQSIGSFSHMQINVRGLWVRLEDNPAHTFASNKRDQIKVVVYHITSSFEQRKIEVPVCFRLIKKTGVGKHAKTITVIEEKFLIPSVTNLSETKLNDLSLPTLLQKFEGEYNISLDDSKFSKLESGTYYYEILVDYAVEKRSYEFQLINKMFGK